MKTLVLYTKSGCPFCSLLKLELSKRGKEVVVFDLSNDSDRNVFYANTGVSTVPQLYVTDDDSATLIAPSGRRIGGWTDVSARWDELD